jgi:hypothetical protein
VILFDSSPLHTSEITHRTSRSEDTASSFSPHQSWPSQRPDLASDLVSRMMPPSFISIAVALVSSLLVCSPVSAYRDPLKTHALQAQALLPPNGLPLRTHIYADHTCSRSRAHLYYLPDGFCIGPLYFPASSILVSNAVPENCTLMAYEDGHCRQGTEVQTRGSGSIEVGVVRGRVVKRWGNRQKGIVGPTGKGSCFGVGEDDEEHGLGGPRANSFYLRC